MIRRPNGRLDAPNRQVQAVSVALGVEYATVYALAAGGGRLATAPTQAGPLAATRAAFDAHRVRRDALIAALQAASAVVPVAAAAYQVQPGSGGADTVRFLAGIADGSTVAYRTLLAGLTDPGLRQLAVDAVAEDARYAALLRWAAGASDADATTALPG